MRDFMEFLIYLFESAIGSLFEIDIGGYSFGSFLTATCVVSIFVSTLVIRFRSANDVSSVSKPYRKSDRPKRMKNKG